MRRFAATVPVLLVVLLVFASAAGIQAAPKVPRVGMLCAPLCAMDAFSEGCCQGGGVCGFSAILKTRFGGAYFRGSPPVRPPSSAFSPTSSACERGTNFRAHLPPPKPEGGRRCT